MRRFRCSAGQHARLGLVEALGGDGDAAGLRAVRVGHAAIVPYGTDNQTDEVTYAGSC